MFCVTLFTHVICWVFCDDVIEQLIEVNAHFSKVIPTDDVNIHYNVVSRQVNCRWNV